MKYADNDIQRFAAAQAMRYMIAHLQKFVREESAVIGFGMSFLKHVDWV